MGYYGRFEDKVLAQKLRREGYSYGEILRRITVSKDTLSRWCRDIQLTPEQKQRLLQNKLLGQKKGSLIAADNKRQIRLLRTKKILQEAKKHLGKIYSRDKFIAGIALYAAEGDKTDGSGGITNSDPKIIKFMMNWFTTYCKVSKEKFRGAIWIHEGNNEEKAKIFWSTLTGIPTNQFYKTYIVKKKPSTSIRKNIHPYGVFSINFNHSDTQRRILGWISALIHAKIPSVR